VYEQIVAAGADLWTIAPQDVATNQALRERRDLPFPILADVDQGVIHQWGIFNFEDPKGRAIPYPSTFVVGQDGLIAWAYIGKATRDRPTPGAVLAAVRDITRPDRAPPGQPPDR
jgi:peroxiredoxin